MDVNDPMHSVSPGPGLLVNETVAAVIPENQNGGVPGCGRTEDVVDNSGVAVTGLHEDLRMEDDGRAENIDTYSLSSSTEIESEDDDLWQLEAAGGTDAGGYLDSVLEDVDVDVLVDDVGNGTRTAGNGRLAEKDGQQIGRVGKLMQNATETSGVAVMGGAIEMADREEDNPMGEPHGGTELLEGVTNTLKNLSDGSTVTVHQVQGESSSSQGERRRGDAERHGRSERSDDGRRHLSYSRSSGGQYDRHADRKEGRISSRQGRDRERDRGGDKERERRHSSRHRGEQRREGEREGEGSSIGHNRSGSEGGGQGNSEAARLVGPDGHGPRFKSDSVVRYAGGESGGGVGHTLWGGSSTSSVQQQQPSGAGAAASVTSAADDRRKGWVARPAFGAATHRSTSTSAGTMSGRSAGMPHSQSGSASVSGGGSSSSRREHRSGRHKHRHRQHRDNEEAAIAGEVAEGTGGGGEGGGEQEGHPSSEMNRSRSVDSSRRQGESNAREDGHQHRHHRDRDRDRDQERDRRRDRDRGGDGNHDRDRAYPSSSSSSTSHHRLQPSASASASISSSSHRSKHRSGSSSGGSSRSKSSRGLLSPTSSSSSLQHRDASAGAQALAHSASTAAPSLPASSSLAPSFPASLSLSLSANKDTVAVLPADSSGAYVAAVTGAPTGAGVVLEAGGAAECVHFVCETPRGATVWREVGGWDEQGQVVWGPGHEYCLAAKWNLGYLPQTWTPHERREEEGTGGTGEEREGKEGGESKGQAGEGVHDGGRTSAGAGAGAGDGAAAAAAAGTGGGHEGGGQTVRDRGEMGGSGKSKEQGVRGTDHSDGSDGHGASGAAAAPGAPDAHAVGAGAGAAGAGAPDADAAGAGARGSEGQNAKAAPGADRRSKPKLQLLMPGVHPGLVGRPLEAIELGARVRRCAGEVYPVWVLAALCVWEQRGKGAAAVWRIVTVARDDPSAGVIRQLYGSMQGVEVQGGKSEGSAELGRMMRELHAGVIATLASKEEEGGGTAGEGGGRGRWPGELHASTFCRPSPSSVYHGTHTRTCTQVGTDAHTYKDTLACSQNSTYTGRCSHTERRVGRELGVG